MQASALLVTAMLAFFGVGAGVGLSPATAWAQDTAAAAAVDAATKLNKKALEEYDNLSFDVARRTLDEALALCTKNGLDDHPIKARTHVHIAVVLLAAGAANRDAAVKEFQKALAIQSDIKLSTRIANPEVQGAFDEAKANIAAAPATARPSKPEKPASSPTPRTATPVGEPAPPTLGLSHDALTSAPEGTPIPISVTTEASLAAKKVALWYRPNGVAKYASLDLREYTPGNWSGSIPDSATNDGDVSYYVSAENENGEVVGTAGSANAPFVVLLKNPRAAAPSRKPEPEEPDEAKPTPPPEEHTWQLALALGTGIGWASGNGDVNASDKVQSGFGASRLGHIAPEIGYFVAPDMILSLQLRWQMVSGATAVRDPSGTMCGSDRVCSPAGGAVAAFARITWLFGEGVFVPFVSAAAGAGQIRHLASFPAAVPANCGSDPNKPVACVDTVTAGPILLGPGAGFVLHATDNLGFMLGVNTLLGVPKFTFHFDFNAGIVVEL